MCNSTKDSMKTCFTLCHAIEVPLWPAMDLCECSRLSPERSLHVDMNQDLGFGSWSDLRELTVVALIQEIFQSCIPNWHFHEQI